MTTSNFSIEVDRASESEWSRLVEQFLDSSIYQTWSYGATRWGKRNVSHLVLRRDCEVVAAAQLRIVRPAQMRIGVAYLRWGPLCQARGKDLEPAVLAAMADA